MLAFHNDPAIRNFYVARARQHQEADEIVQGSYWNGTRGCCVGCLAHDNINAHEVLERDAGIPLTVSRLADRIHERLSPEESKCWPVRFVEAVPAGADLSRAGWQFLHWLLTDFIQVNGGGQIYDGVRAALARSAAVIEPATRGETIDRAAAYAARAAAYAAAYAAYAAAYAAADAAYAAADAAYAAADAADAAGKDDVWPTFADKLVALIASAPVPEVQP